MGGELDMAGARPLGRPNGDAKPRGRKTLLEPVPGPVDPRHGQPRPVERELLARPARTMVGEQKKHRRPELGADEARDRPGADKQERHHARRCGRRQRSRRPGKTARTEAPPRRQNRMEQRCRALIMLGHGPDDRAPARAAPAGLAAEARPAHEAGMETAPRKPRARPARPTARRMPAADVRPFIEALARANPAPRTELHYGDTFQLLVAVVLSAQTTDAAVNKVTPALFAAAPTPEAMAALGEAGIAPLIRTIGLWQAKARNLAALARQLVERHGGVVPADRAALEALPGVGRKTANVVLNVAFGQPTMAVDTHIFRLGNRTGLAPGKTPRAVEEALIARVPPEYLRDAHHWLILHGRYVCKARRPECWRCVVAQWCRYGRKTPPPAEAPKAGDGPRPRGRAVLPRR